MLSTQLYKRESIVSKNSPLFSIYQKIKEDKRISEKEALSLFKSQDILEIGVIANLVKQRYTQNKIYYILNGHINYSNICTNHCSFCSFSKKRGEKSAYEMSLLHIKNKFNEFNLSELSEIHIVGGLHPDFPFSYYTNMIQAIKKVNPSITVKAFTAAEIDHFSHLFQMPAKDILNKLIDCGLGTLPGGGAEIFSEKIRKKICPTKMSGNNWLKIHKIAHQLGLKTNATMLFGHIESYEDRVDHLKRLRDLQDQTSGFQTFIPLTYHSDHNSLHSKRTSGLDNLKTMAISRIFLDNFPHIKAYWIMLGVKIAQISLNFGADDIDGTVLEERITHTAGATSPLMLSKKELRQLILECQKVPVERDSFYNEITN